ncbi:hypothetical protein vseg_008224 [Gypsophila vaccaria]
MIIEKQELMVSPPTTHNKKNPKLKNSQFINPNFPNQFPQNPQLNPQTLDTKTLKNLAKSINFKGIKSPNDAWRTWVHDLRKTHEIIWKKVGIFDAIKASTYIIKKDDEFIVNLGNFWCVDTSTFIFPWGECSFTLEDVVVLGGFSVLGDSVINVGNVEDFRSRFEELRRNLVDCSLEIKRRCNYHIPFYEWMKFFKGKGGDLENVGLIVQWLSRYVFCVDQFDVDVNCFDFAVSLCLGCRIALAPAVLASIYRDLGSLKRKCVSSDYESKVVLWSPLHLVQVWAWERFPRLSPKARCLSFGEPRIARWHDLYKVKIDGVGSCLESCAGGFLWRPYARDVENWEFPKFYSEEGMFVVLNNEGDEELLSLARCLGVSELVGMDCVEQYLPHRVGMQFGFDQDVVDFVPRLNGDLKLAWSSYDKPVDGVKLYVPPRLREGEVTERYSKLWTRVSPPRDDALEESGKKRKRKKGGSNLKTKKASVCEVSPVSSSQGCEKIISFDLSGSGKERSIEVIASLNVMASQADNETVSRSVMNSSQPANLIDKIDLSVAANEALFLKEPFQGLDAERSAPVHAADIHRIDAVQTDFTESINDFTKWCNDFS